MRRIFTSLIPFLFFGILVVILAAGLIIVSYLLIWGAIVGLILFLIAWIKEKLFPSKHLTRTNPSKSSGRTIDHEK